MKKLLIVLTVVSMAALLFAGCLPTPNTPPVITYSASQTAIIGTEFSSTVTATDAEGDTLAFSISGGPTGMVIDSTTGVISGWTPAAAGTETVLLSVTDGTDTVTLLVTITASGPVETEITIAVATETLPDADGKIFVKGGSNEIIVTFPDVVEDPVVKVGTAVVPVFTVDDKVFKGTGTFVGDAAVVIEVSGVCDTNLCAAKSVVVDSTNPVVEVEAKAEECACEDTYKLTITSEQELCVDCVVDPGCCKDAGSGSGLKSWNVKIFDEDPWKVPTFDDPCDEPDCEPCCSDDPCVDPIVELDGTACPIIITTECIEAELVWSELYGYWYTETYFTKQYFVIVTLTDNVDNKTTYYGIVDPGEDELTNYVNYFQEIIHPNPDDATECWCPAESEYDADSVLGDCDGTPATVCYVVPIVLDDCPEVTFDPAVIYAGEEITITIDYTDAVKPVGTVSAYIGVNIKTLPEGVPEDSAVLILHTDDDVIYTATYTFGSVGEDYLYIIAGCENCDYCREIITVLEPLPIPCTETDVTPPQVDLMADVVESAECGDACDPDPGSHIIITSDADLCDPLCCGDDCTDDFDWTLTVYDTQPFIPGVCPPDCIPVNACIEPVEECTGVGCPVECDVFGCIPDDEWADLVTIGTYYVIFEATDRSDNLNSYTDYGILVVGGTSADPTATLNDAEVDDDCEFALIADLECCPADDHIMGPCTCDICPETEDPCDPCGE